MNKMSKHEQVQMLKQNRNALDFDGTAPKRDFRAEQIAKEIDGFVQTLPRAKTYSRDEFMSLVGESTYDGVAFDVAETVISYPCVKRTLDDGMVVIDQDSLLKHKFDETYESISLVLKKVPSLQPYALIKKGGFTDYVRARLVSFIKEKISPQEVVMNG